jgi:TatD DNase family protein
VHERSGLIDTHCHLNFENFASDQLDVVERARQVGVKAVINPGIDIVTSREAVTLSQKFDLVYAAVGVHPHNAQSWNTETISGLETLIKEKKVVAIGEIGLDYYRDRAPREIQINVLERQLEFAADSNLPVIIHNRDASQDVMDILESWHNGLVKAGSPLAERPGVLHSFLANIEIAERAIRANFYLGITAVVTFRNATEHQAVVKDLPIDSLVIETDAPFLAPQIHRGGRNEPAYVQYTAMKIAELQNRSFEKVVKATTMHAQSLFQIGEKLLA